MTDTRAVIVGGMDSLAWLVNNSHSHDETLRWEALLTAAGEDRVAAIAELDRVLAENARLIRERDESVRELRRVRSAWQVQTAEWSDMQREFRANIRNLKAERDAALKLVDDTLVALGAAEVRSDWKGH